MRENYKEALVVLLEVNNIYNMLLPQKMKLMLPHAV